MSIIYELVNSCYIFLVVSTATKLGENLEENHA